MIGRFKPRDEPVVMTVTQLTALVRRAIQAGLPDEVLVAGELSNVSRPQSGHLYFTLKDSGSEVRCVMWRSEATRIRFRPEDGMAVIVTGRVDVFEPRGQYQVYARRLEPRGVGALELAFRQLKERLAREGLFDPARKRPLPPYPRRIAVVTSPTGAAIRDILHTIRRRYPAVEVLVYPVRVQGEGAAEEIAAAIRDLDRQAARLGGIDVMIVGRGGGSLEDLWAFNEEVVARAIFDSRIPLVSAVGHEVDFTIADFVADVRAATPTAAAELVVPLMSEVIARLDATEARMQRAVGGLMDLAMSRLTAVLRNEWFRDPIRRVRQYQQLVDEILGRLRLCVTRRLANLRTALHAREVALARGRPEVVLARRRERLARIEHRMRWAQSQAARTAERRLAAFSARLVRVGPQRVMDRHAEWLRQADQRLRRAQTGRLAESARRLDALAARLAASSHEQVLHRGFSITRRARDRRIIRKPADVRPDERLVTQTAEGDIQSTVVDAQQGQLFD